MTSFPASNRVLERYQRMAIGAQLNARLFKMITTNLAVLSATIRVPTRDNPRYIIKRDIFYDSQPFFFVDPRERVSPGEVNGSGIFFSFSFLLLLSVPQPVRKSIRRGKRDLNPGKM